MTHHVEINLDSASVHAQRARQDVADAHKLQKQAQAIKVCILVGSILIILLLILSLVESNMCQFLSFC